MSLPIVRAVSPRLQRNPRNTEIRIAKSGCCFPRSFSAAQKRQEVSLEPGKGGQVSGSRFGPLNIPRPLASEVLLSMTGHGAELNIEKDQLGRLIWDSLL